MGKMCAFPTKWSIFSQFFAFLSNFDYLGDFGACSRCHEAGGGLVANPDLNMLIVTGDHYSHHSIEKVSVILRYLYRSLG
eukprot:728863-Amphidinium_carterae.1